MCMGSRCFNGAAPIKAWKQSLAKYDRVTCSWSFNGSAPIKTRKRGIGPAMEAKIWELQWGRAD